MVVKVIVASTHSLNFYSIVAATLIFGDTKPPPAARAHSSASTASAPVSPAVAVWREKLNFLLEQEAIAADLAQKS